jgi:ferredoxin-like protein FixX
MTMLRDFPGGMPNDAQGSDDDDASPQPPTEEDGSTFGGYAGDGTTTDPTDEGADTAEPGYDDNSQMPPSTDLLARARWAANVRMAQKKRTMKKRTMSLKVPMTKMEESLQDDPTFMQFCGAYCPAGCNTEADCLGDSANGVAPKNGCQPCGTCYMALVAAINGQAARL